MKPEVKIFERQPFVEARYKNFLAKKKWLKENGLEAAYHMTDLDRTYKGFTKPMKDVVICDRCQEDVQEHIFVMVENSFVYHRACVLSEYPELFMEEEPKIEPASNVVFLHDFRKKFPASEEDPSPPDDAA